MSSTNADTSFFNWFRASHWPNCVMRINCSVLLMASFVAYTTQTEARAETITLQNDSVAIGTSAAVQTGFLSGDIAASIFNLPPGVEAMKITRVDAIMQVDPEHVAFETICDLHLYCGGLPDPANPVASKLGGLFNAGLNRMDLSDESWIVRSGSPFAIGLRYNWAVGNIDPTSTHIVTDTDGCQSGQNMLYESATGTWFDPCAFGIPGDFSIRVTGEVIPSKAPFGDFNHDGSVDMVDFGAFQRCISSTGTVPSAECVAAFDCDRDGRVNETDFLEFIACLTGPGIPLDPACGSCLPAGICSAGGLVKLLEDLKSKRGDDPQLAFAWIWVLKAIVVLVLLLVGWGFISKSQVSGDLQVWMSQFRCPHPGSLDAQRLREAIEYLRDTLGATDPEAWKIGKYLMDEKYYECGKLLIAEGRPNPREFIAHNPIRTVLIYIDRDYVEWRYFKEVLALILYAESSHFLDANGIPLATTDEPTCQRRLDAFRQRHNMSNILPELRHGVKEGFFDK